jgi:hypothetical protein
MPRRNDRLSRLAKYALFVAIAFLCSRASAAEGMSRTILDTSGFWRIHYTLRPPVVKTLAGVQTIAQPRCLWLNRDTTPPPDDWRSVDFDDSSWWRSPGAVFPVRRLEWLKLPDLDFGFSDLDYSTVYLAHLAMRGKFAVPDSSRAGDLSLSLTYRGGVVVYLNGKEVARGDMPQGEIDRDTLANDYPREAFEAANGKLLSAEHRESDRARCELHNRGLKDVTIPARLLRKGINVLAISVHRAPHHEVVLTHQAEKKPFLLLWSTCGLSSVRLDARGEVVPNCTRPNGLQAWNSNPLAVDFDLDWGDPQERLAAIRLVGARNGVFSGKVVLGGTEPVRKLSAKISDLASKEGAMISAARVLIRYATADRWENGASQYYPAAVTAFDGLEETPPAEVEVRAKKAGRGNWVSPGQPPHVDGAVQPVWITVKVPADARPGDYAGELEIAAGGQTFRVPVELRVCGWRVPDPQDFVSFCELIQSPETVAMKYHVPFWSEQHFALIGRSLSFLGQVGSPTTYLPVVCRTNMGNDYSMVRWIRQPGGGYRHDYALLEKCLDAVVQHQGVPKIVCIYIWDYHCNDGEIPVTGLSADGKMETIHLPKYSDPQSVELWKPVIAGIRQRLRGRGLEAAMMFGVCGDTTPNREAVGFFKALSPGTPWIVDSHGSAAEAVARSFPLGCYANVWSSRFAEDPAESRRYGWNRPDLKMHFMRGRHNDDYLVTYRFLAEINVAGDQRGFGRLGADFWPVFPDSKGLDVGTLGTRYNSWRNLDIETSVLSAGKNGAIGTHRFETLREGIQEAEARIFIEKALLGKKIDGALAERCQAILDDRTAAMLRGVNDLVLSPLVYEKYPQNPHGWWQYPCLGASYPWYAVSGWQDRSRALFEAAADVQRALGKN